MVLLPRSWGMSCGVLPPTLCRVGRQTQRLPAFSPPVWDRRCFALPRKTHLPLACGVEWRCAARVTVPLVRRSAAKQAGKGIPGRSRVDGALEGEGAAVPNHLGGAVRDV